MKHSLPNPKSLICFKGKFLSVSFSAIFLLFSTVLLAQQPRYQFTAVQGTYTSISNATVSSLTPVNVNSGTTISATDEGFQNGVLIGFPFVYDSVTYNVVNINTDGYVTLGSGFGINSLARYFVNDLANGPTPLANAGPILAPLWDDLDMRSDTNLTYITTGVAPNRVFTVQWQNAWWDYANTSPVISFQLKLYESTNVIEFVYKPLSGKIDTYSGGASIGITESKYGPGTYISLSDASTNPTPSYIKSYDSILSKPVIGQIYRFTPLTGCNGKLTAGNTIASVSNICPYHYFSLSLDGSSAFSDLKYQWQSLLPGSTWTNISSDTSVAATDVFIKAATKFRCSITCPSIQASTVYSTPVNISLSTTGVCPPQNDEVVGAISLTHKVYDSTYVGSSFDMTNATGSLTPSSFFTRLPNDDIWFSFVATLDKAIFRLSNVNAVSGNLGNIAFGFYSGTSTNLVDGYGQFITLNGNSGESGLITGLIVGNTYYIRLATTGSKWLASGNISVLHPAIEATYTNSCYSTDLLTIDDTNNYGWQSLTYGNKIIADIDAQGNNLGAINANLFVNATAIRTDKKGVYYLDRNFEIDPTVSSNKPIKLRLYFKNHELNKLIAEKKSGVTSLINLKASIDSAGCGDTVFAKSTLIKPTATSLYDDSISYVEVSTLLPNLSSFFLHGGSLPLPIIFNNISGNKINGNVYLSWGLLNSNTITLTIERSFNGVDFVNIGLINGTNGNNKYDFEDNNPLSTNGFYRIVAKDANGETVTSNTIFIRNGVTNNFVVYAIHPNPVHSVLTAEFGCTSSTVINIKIVDIYGKVLITKNYHSINGINKITMDVSNLPTGTYFVNFIDDNNKYSSLKKIVKY